MKNFSSILLIICFGLVPKIALAQNTYPVLEKQINKKQYKQAYQQATKLLAQNEGEPRFDYLYGLSALQTGHYNEAVFALDRVTVATPRAIRPRLELARTYLKLNNKKAAIKEFNDVLSLSPPPIVRQKVNAYIVELEKRDKKIQQSVIKKLASFSIGYDDNINFGTDSTEVDLPGVGSIKLNPSSIGQGSGFAETKFQLRHRKIRDRRSNRFSVVNLTHRKYLKDTDFDYTDLDLRTGVTLNSNKKQYQFVVRDRPVALDGKLHSNTIGADAIVRKGIGKGKVVSASVSVENYDNKKVPLSDRQRAVVGARLDTINGKIQHQFNFSVGREWPSKKAGKQFSRDIAGAAYKATVDWNAKNKSFVSMDYRHFKHQEAYPVFPDKRKDKRAHIKAVHEWQFTENTAIIFSASHTGNMSNLDLYDADRNEVKIGIRYEWD